MRQLTHFLLATAIAWLALAFLARVALPPKLLDASSGLAVGLVIVVISLALGYLHTKRHGSKIER